VSQQAVRMCRRAVLWWFWFFNLRSIFWFFP